MRYILMLTIDELRSLEKGNVVNCNFNGIKTQIVCADDIKEAITIIEADKGE